MKYFIFATYASFAIDVMTLQLKFHPTHNGFISDQIIDHHTRK